MFVTVPWPCWGGGQCQKVGELLPMWSQEDAETWQGERETEGFVLH